jgi:signal transduction histidine kinase
MASLHFRPTLAAALVLGLLLGILGWVDYRAVSRELESVVRSEAEALHATVAAAAGAQHAAAGHAEAALQARVLEIARLLRVMDAGQPLTPATLQALAGPQAGYRVMLFNADGTRAYTAGDLPDGRGWGGRGGAGLGLGLGAGRGRGGPPATGGLAQRLLAGEADEVTSQSQPARGGQERIAAGVRRAGGGAIVVNAANEAAAEFDEIYSLASLLDRIAAATPSLAYVMLDEAEHHVSAGPLANAVPAADDEAEERVLAVAGVRVLERRSAIPLGEARIAALRTGMRLDHVTQGERRTLARVVLGAAAAFGLALLALAFGSLRQRYGALSAEHARAQEALRRRDRLAAMGEMASTVAHEIRNPLNAIAMSAQRLAREYPLPAAAADRDELSDLLGVIQGESARIDTTVQQFLEFARPRPLNRREVPLAEVVAVAAAAARPLGAPRGVTVQERVDERQLARLDPDQLRQALENLLRNAVEASPEGGTVRLDARRDGASSIFVVADEGPGIPADTLPRIFDLYFTTKTQGTGIGLAVAQQVVAAHGGTIEVDSEPGRGTRMVVRVPDGKGAGHE